MGRKRQPASASFDLSSFPTAFSSLPSLRPSCLPPLPHRRAAWLRPLRRPQFKLVSRAPRGTRPPGIDHGRGIIPAVQPCVSGRRRRRTRPSPLVFSGRSSLLPPQLLFLLMHRALPRRPAPTAALPYRRPRMQRPKSRASLLIKSSALPPHNMSSSGRPQNLS